MSDLFKIAWRNIRRNKRRTIITAASVFFAVFLALIMRSFQLGTYDYMINTMVEMYSGYIRIEQKNFPDEQSINNSLPQNPELSEKLSKIDNVKSILPKLNYGALASYGTQTKFALITGLVPEKETEVSGIHKRIVSHRISEKALDRLKKDLPEAVWKKLNAMKNSSFFDAEYLIASADMDAEHEKKFKTRILDACKIPGEFIESGDDGVLVGDRFSKFFDISVGDTLVLTGQGYHGASAAGLFPVRGIIKFPNPQMDRRIVIADLENAQSFFSAVQYTNDGEKQALITSYMINTHKTSDKALAETKAEIEKITADKNYSVRTWKEADKELAQQIKGDNQSGIMMIGVLYVIIGFGILGTVLMLIAERKRETGVMIALGMRKIRVVTVITLELFFLSFLGVLAGLLASAPIIIFGHKNPLRLTGETAQMMEQYGIEPLMPMAWFDTYILNQVGVIALIVLLVMIYPLIAVMRMKVIDALRA